MFNVSQFLEKFKTLGLGEIVAKEALIGALKEVVGVEIERKDIELKNGVFYVKASPILKNQMYIKKTSLIECLNEKLENKVKDVR